MATKPKWADLSDIQRRSWRLVGPFLGAHFLVNLLLLVAYALGITGAVAGNGACHAIEAVNTGVSDLLRALGGPGSLDRICQLYVPVSLVNLIFAAIFGIIVVLSRGIGVIGSRYFLPLLISALLPLILLALNPSKTATASLALSLRSGSWTAYIVFLIGPPLVTGMFAALPLQKYKGGHTHGYDS